MYYLKNNDLDKGRVYIYCTVRHKLHLRLPDNTSGGKANSSWNNKFNITQPYASELINKLGLNGKEKIRRIEFQNIEKETYKDIPTIDHFRRSNVWRNYDDEYTSRFSITRLKILKI